jgi:hypothetical protein
MKSLWIALILSVVVAVLSIHPAAADDDGRRFPKNVRFTTLVITPRCIEGLTGDHNGNLYVGARGWHRVTLTS